MKLPREIAAIAMILGLAGGNATPACAQTQIVEPLGEGILPVQITGIVTRAQMREVRDQPRSLGILPTYSPEFHSCMSEASRSNPLTSFEPEQMKQRLVTFVAGKTVAQLQSMIQQIESEPNRNGKMRLMFWGGASPPATPPLPWPVLSVADQRQLQMGQEVSIGGPYCFMNAQIDQIIAEGLRVMRAVLQNLQAQSLPGGAQPGGADIKPQGVQPTRPRP